MVHKNKKVRIALDVGYGGGGGVKLWGNTPHHLTKGAQKDATGGKIGRKNGQFAYSEKQYAKFRK